eukprot:3452751-Ditylum_brightwellii.AAC.1
MQEGRHGNCNDDNGVAEINVVLVENGLAWKEMIKLLCQIRSGVSDVRNKDAALVKKPNEGRGYDTP